VSSSARTLDLASGVPVRGREHFIELTYQAQLNPWLQVQPDFQYVFSPGGGVLNPNNPSVKLRDEAIFGIRTGITF
jgi:porin